MGKPTRVTDTKKPVLTAAKPAVLDSAAKTMIPLVIAGKQAGVSSIAARSVKPVATVTKQVVSTHRPVVASLSAKVKVHLETVGSLLPIGEGAYQSAEAVEQRTLL